MNLEKNRPLYARLLSLGAVVQVNPWSFKGPELARFLQNRSQEIEILWAQKETHKIEALFDRLGPWLDQKSPSLKFSLTLPLFADTDWPSMEAVLSRLYENGLSLIHWRLDAPGLALPRDLLWKASKRGIWNHISADRLFLPDRFPDRAWIAASPNIVHSFEDTGIGAVDGGFRAPDALLSYKKLSPLPGRPIREVLQKPGRILACLARVPKNELLRMRVDTGEKIICLGRGIEYFFKKPHEVPLDLMEEIIAMVDAGGSVDITHVRANLKKAYLIGYAMENGRVAGNSSLKHPRQVFIDRLRGMTGLDFTHCVERGYTSVRPEYRAMGMGAKLLEGLTARAQDVKVFSIISEDNLATQKIALRNRTRKLTTYFSRKLGKEMGIWMPEHMISKEWEGEQ